MILDNFIAGQNSTQEDSMNVQKSIAVVAALSFALIGCSGQADDQSSAKNSVTLRGVAATGYAMARAKIEIKGQNGEVLYTGTTNDSGKYDAEIGTEDVDFPLLVTVSQDSNEFSNIVFDDQDSNSYTVNLNPITDWVYEAAYSEDVDWDSFDSLAQSKMDSLLGKGFDYEDFAYGEGYVAAVEGVEGVVPCGEDMILHLLEQWSTKKGMEWDELLDSLAAEEAQLLWNDEQFQVEWTLLMDEYGWDSTGISGEIAEIVDEEYYAEIMDDYEGILDNYYDIELSGTCMDEKIASLQTDVMVLERQLAESESTGNDSAELKASYDAAVEKFLAAVENSAVQCSEEVESQTELSMAQ